MRTMQFHPVSTLFPFMPDNEFADLVADITANGLREPIHLLGDAIVDGGNRKVDQAANLPLEKTRQESMVTQ